MKKNLRLAAALVAALSTTSSHAFWNDRLELYADETMTWDSNVFRLSKNIDSESLLGRGDMLYLPSGSARVVRVHAPLVTEKEIAAAVEFWRAQGLAQYEEKFLQAPKDENAHGQGGAAGDDEEEHDEMFEDAVRLVLEFGKASTSLIQRRPGTTRR